MDYDGKRHTVESLENAKKRDETKISKVSTFLHSLPEQHSVSLCVSVTVCVSLYASVIVCVSLSVCLCYGLCESLCLCDCLCKSLCLGACLCVSLCLSLFLLLSMCPPLFASRRLTVYLYYSLCPINAFDKFC